MGGKNFAGMRRYQPEKSQMPERNKSLSPKKRVESNDWIDASLRPRHVPVPRSPKKTLPMSPIRENLDRTEKWVEETVLQKSEHQETSRGHKRRARDHKEDTEDDADPSKNVKEKPREVVNVHEPGSSESAKNRKEVPFAKVLMNPRAAGLDENEERWIYWRIWDFKIDAVLEKHKGKFQERYLSHKILTQVFSPPDVPGDGKRDLEQITLKVTKKPPVFHFGSRGKRLTVSTRVYPTGKSAKDVEKTVLVAANGSLALLMDQVLEVRDLLTITRESGPSFADLIVLNAKSLGENTTRIVHFRPKFMPQEVEDYDNLKCGYFKVEEEWKGSGEGCEGRIMVRPVRPEDVVNDQEPQVSDKEEVSSVVRAGKVTEDPVIAINSERSSDSKTTAFTTSQQSASHSVGYHPDVFEQSVTQRTQSDSVPVKNNVVTPKVTDDVEEKDENAKHPNSAKAQTNTKTQSNAKTKDNESENPNESPEVVLLGPPASKRKQNPTKSSASGKNAPYNTQELNAGLFTQETHDQILEDLCRETQPFITDHLFEDDSPPAPPDAPASKSPVASSSEGSKVNQEGRALKEKVVSMQLETQYFPLDCLDSQMAYDDDSAKDIPDDSFEDSGDYHSDHSALISRNKASEESQANYNEEESLKPPLSSCIVA